MEDVKFRTGRVLLSWLHSGSEIGWVGENRPKRPASNSNHMRLAAWLKQNWLILTGWAGIAMTTAGASAVAHQVGAMHTPVTGAGAAILTVGASLLTVARLAMKYTIVEDGQ